MDPEHIRQMAEGNDLSNFTPRTPTTPRKPVKRVIPSSKRSVDRPHQRKGPYKMTKIDNRRPKGSPVIARRRVVLDNDCDASCSTARKKMKMADRYEQPAMEEVAKYMEDLHNECASSEGSSDSEKKKSKKTTRPVIFGFPSFSIHKKPMSVRKKDKTKAEQAEADKNEMEELSDMQEKMDITDTIHHHKPEEIPQNAVGWAELDPIERARGGNPFYQKYLNIIYYPHTWMGRKRFRQPDGKYKDTPHPDVDYSIINPDYPKSCLEWKVVDEGNYVAPDNMQ